MVLMVDDAREAPGKRVENAATCEPIGRNRRNDGDFNPEKHKLFKCKNQLINGEAR
jgi:hypothetical protein